MGFELVSPKRRHIKEIIELLQDVSNFIPQESQIQNIWEFFINQENVFGVIVIDEDKKNDYEKIIGFGSLHFSKKIRGGCIGFIEDVVVSKKYRKKGIGEMIIKYLINKAKQESCYKLVLECKDETKIFYKKMGFKKSGHAMSMILANYI